jgi:hypothetical protein
MELAAEDEDGRPTTSNASHDASLFSKADDDDEMGNENGSSCGGGAGVAAVGGGGTATRVGSARTTSLGIIFLLPVVADDADFVFEADDEG